MSRSAAHVINTLDANRGGNSEDVPSRGPNHQPDQSWRPDREYKHRLAGYQQNYTLINTTIRGTTNLNSPFGSPAPAPPPQPSNAQPFGGMTLHVAGSVTNSVFAASVEPALVGTNTTKVYDNTAQVNGNATGFGAPNQVALTGGRITAKIEGTINNTIATPNTPTQAVFASQSTKYTGPVIPPAVPQEPFTGPTSPSKFPGLPDLNSKTKTTK